MRGRNQEVFTQPPAVAASRSCELDVRQLVQNRRWAWQRQTGEGLKVSYRRFSRGPRLVAIAPPYASCHQGERSEFAIFSFKVGVHLA
jgi:hypothetical protein